MTTSNTNQQQTNKQAAKLEQQRKARKLPHAGFDTNEQYRLPSNLNEVAKNITTLAKKHHIPIEAKASVIEDGKRILELIPLKDMYTIDFGNFYEANEPMFWIKDGLQSKVVDKFNDSKVTSFIEDLLFTLDHFAKGITSKFSYDSEWLWNEASKREVAMQLVRTRITNTALPAALPKLEPRKGVVL
jgi:hypothetical protein